MNIESDRSIQRSIGSMTTTINRQYRSIDWYRSGHAYERPEERLRT